MLGLRREYRFSETTDLADRIILPLRSVELSKLAHFHEAVQSQVKIRERESEG